jgi:hypothetical protein
VPQRQNTAPTIAADLPDLTEQQMEFVRHLLAGKTGAEAYRLAYDCRNSTPATIIANASRLRADANVSAWLAAAREAHLGTAVLTRDSHMAELERIREIALKSGNIGAAVAAETARGKVAGHQVETVRDITERNEPADMLRELAQTHPSIAEQLAKDAGIELPGTDTRH